MGRLEVLEGQAEAQEVLAETVGVVGGRAACTGGGEEGAACSAERTTLAADVNDVRELDTVEAVEVLRGVVAKEIVEEALVR